MIDGVWFEVDDDASRNTGYLMYKCQSSGCGAVLKASQLTDHRDTHLGRRDYGRPEAVVIEPRFQMLRWILWKVWDERFFIFMVIVVILLVNKLFE